MSIVRELASEIGELFKTRSEHQAQATWILKITFILLSGVAATAQFMTIPDNADWTPANFVGIAASIVVAIAALYLAIAVKDASTELDAARRAIEKAREAEAAAEDLARDYRDFERYEIEQTRANELYRAMFTMREVIKQSLGTTSDALWTITLLLKTAERSLNIALGFQPAEHHTLCVYVAETEPDTHKTYLRCIAQSRTIACDIKNARRWPVGVGVGGVAFARGTVSRRTRHGCPADRHALSG